MNLEERKGQLLFSVKVVGDYFDYEYFDYDFHEVFSALEKQFRKFIDELNSHFIKGTSDLIRKYAVEVSESLNNTVESRRVKFDSLRGELVNQYSKIKNKGLELSQSIDKTDKENKLVGEYWNLSFYYSNYKQFYSALNSYIIRLDYYLENEADTFDSKAPINLSLAERLLLLKFLGEIGFVPIPPKRSVNMSNFHKFYACLFEKSEEHIKKTWPKAIKEITSDMLNSKSKGISRIDTLDKLKDVLDYIQEENPEVRSIIDKINSQKDELMKIHF